MKFFGSFLLLVFGFVWEGVAQEVPRTDFNSDKPLFLPRSKFDLPENLRFFSPDTSRLDSGMSFFPGGLAINREINPVSTFPYQSRMPMHLLPDPQSRMPVKVFGNSVNYTILRKEYK